jgi:hypothetical protein
MTWYQKCTPSPPPPRFPFHLPFYIYFTLFLNKGMRELIQTIFRIPASNKECDSFFHVISNNKKHMNFCEMFRALEGGIINNKNIFVQAKKCASVSDQIGHFNDKDNTTKPVKKNIETSFDDTASWVSLASTRAPSIQHFFNNTPRSTTNSHASHNSSQPSRGGSSSCYKKKNQRPSTAGTSRSLRSNFTQPRSSIPSVRSSIPSSRRRPATASTSRNRRTTVDSVMSIAIASAAHYRRLRQLSSSSRARKNTPLYVRPQLTSVRNLY